jgi:hypothetical protein
MRMLGPTGNSRAENLFEIIRFLQRRGGVRLYVNTRLLTIAGVRIGTALGTA